MSGLPAPAWPPQAILSHIISTATAPRHPAVQQGPDLCLVPGVLEGLPGSKSWSCYGLHQPKVLGEGTSPSNPPSTPNRVRLLLAPAAVPQPGQAAHDHRYQPVRIMMDNHTTTHTYTDNNGTVQVTAALPDAGWRPVAAGEALLPLVHASTLRVALWEYEYNDERQHYSIYPRTGSPSPPGLPRTQPAAVAAPIRKLWPA